MQNSSISSRPAMAAVQPPFSAATTTTTLLGCRKLIFSKKLPAQESIINLSSRPFDCFSVRTSPVIATAFKLPPLTNIQKHPKIINHEASQNHHQFLSRAFLGAGFTLVLVVASTVTITSGSISSAAEFPSLVNSSTSSLQLHEPQNALSLPTWAIHVSSVVEWIAAMILVWQYGEQSGYESWKGLSWGMVPLLGGAFCACTWHFFYNSESLSILVALQAALTVIGNFTMCIAAFRICKSSQEGSGKL